MAYVACLLNVQLIMFYSFLYLAGYYLWPCWWGVDKILCVFYIFLWFYTSHRTTLHNLFSFIFLISSVHNLLLYSCSWFLKPRFWESVIRVIRFLVSLDFILLILTLHENTIGFYSKFLSLFFFFNLQYGDYALALHD